MSFMGDILSARGRFLLEQEERLGVQRTPYFIGDKSAYLSPMDRTIVDGRTQHREHMRKHGVMEAGDRKLGEVAHTERDPMGAVGHDIKRAIQELASR